MLKSNIWDLSPHKYMKIKIDSDDDLPLQKPLSMHNIVILIQSVFSKNHDHCYYQFFYFFLIFL